MGLCLFLGIISLVFVMYITQEIYSSIIISSVIVGLLCTGLNFFDTYDEVITSAIYEFIVVFISFYVFFPYNTFINYLFGGTWATAILTFACIGAIIAAAIAFVKTYFIKKENATANSNLKSTPTNNVQNNITANKIEFTDCPECGSIVRIDSIFCEKCGSKIDETIKDTVCMNCGSKLEKDSLFCENCGTKKNQG